VNRKLTFKEFELPELQEIFGDYKFKLSPRWHQYVTFAFGLEKNRVMFWHDIGTGKTITSLYMMNIWGIKRVFVICPNSCIVSETWKKQVKKYTDYNYVDLIGTTNERRKLFTSSALDKHKKLVCCINYEGLKFLFGAKRNLVRKQGSEYVSINKFMIDDCWLEEIQKIGFTGFIADEAHKLQNETAIQTKIAYRISKQMDKVVLMTGSPMPVGELSLWSEYYVLDLGKTLGNSFWRFKLNYFKQNYWKGWEIKNKEKAKKILKLVSPVTLRFNKSECFDLPKIIREERGSNLLPKQSTIYKKLLKKGFAKVGGKELTIADAAGMVNKLRQIVSGFFLEAGEVKTTFPTAKLLLFDEVLQEIEGKAMVFHHFVQEGRMIEQFLRKKKILFASLRGEIKDKRQQVDSFLRNKKIKVMVLNIQSGGEAMDGFQRVCSTMIFYSNSGKGAKPREQCEGRIFRGGQKETCTFIDLVVIDTVDEELIKGGYDERKIARRKLKWMQKKGGMIDAT